jgi:rhodanese-related sulfurtransferase
MSVLDYFKPVPTMPADKVRRFLMEKNRAGYNLIDVRQPKEYEQEHLPGAHLIPLGDLPKRLSELDPGKPTIVY